MKDQFYPSAYNFSEMAAVPRVSQRARTRKMKQHPGDFNDGSMEQKHVWQDLWAEIRDKDHVNGKKLDDVPFGQCYVVVARVDGERAMIPVKGNWSRLRGGGNEEKKEGAPKMLNVKLELKQGRPPPQSYEEFLKDIVAKLTQQICCAAQAAGGNMQGMEDMCKKDEEPEYLVNLSFVNKDDCAQGGPPANYDDFLDSVVQQLSRECPNQDNANPAYGAGPSQMPMQPGWQPEGPRQRSFPQNNGWDQMDRECGGADVYNYPQMRGGGGGHMQASFMAPPRAQGYQDQCQPRFPGGGVYPPWPGM